MADISQQTALILIIILWIIYGCILSPLCFYYLHKIWLLNKKHIAFVVKRHVNILMIAVILFNVYTIIIRPSIETWKIATDRIPYESIWEYVGISIYQIPVAFVSARIWLAYYDYKHDMNTLNRGWQSKITKSEVMDWTTKYKWLGNSRIIIIITATCTVLTLSAILIGGLPLAQYTQQLPGLYALIMLILTFTMRKCRDVFAMRKEFIIISVCWLLSAFIYAFIIRNVVPPETRIRMIVMSIWSACTLYIFCFIPTQYVLSKYYEEQQKNGLLNSVVTTQLPLEEILKDEDGFDLFANHLVKEFSLENLGFIFEMMQLKNEAIKNNLVSKGAAGWMILIASQIRKTKTKRANESNIVDIDALRESVDYIIETYIRDSSEDCVNISSHSRLAIFSSYIRMKNKRESVKGNRKTIPPITQLSESSVPSRSVGDDAEMNKKAAEYVILFDKGLEEVVTLLKQDSLSRFYWSPEYAKLIDEN